MEASFLLSNNPLKCDCSLEWMISTPITLTGPIVGDLKDPKCSPHSVHGLSQSLYLTEVPREELLCRYTQHFFNLCICCTFLACDCRMRHPSSCNCFADKSWNFNRIQCGNKNLSSVRVQRTGHHTICPSPDRLSVSVVFQYLPRPWIDLKPNCSQK